MKGLIVLAGSAAQKPHHGGHAWVFLQYLLGFRQLGWDVLFLDRLEPAMSVDTAGAPCRLEDSANLRYLREVMKAFGLENAFSVACNDGQDFFGLPRTEVLARVRSAATLINVMGFFNDAEILDTARHRVFLDIDPGFGQMWRELGLHDPYRDYHRYVTVGENIGGPGCLVPTCGIDWVTTKQPIVLKHWPVAAAAAEGRFTSIGAWRGPYGPVTYKDNTYGLRAHEFRKFIQLPLLASESFEVALDIHAAETNDMARLSENGWRLVNPNTIASTPECYRAYIAASKAEFMVAKNMYVRTHSGWFSDRSICYLASGKPVLAQDTALADLYQLGKGLLSFSTLEEAAAGVEDISGRYQQHSRAAREIAEEYFDSDRVLQQLLRKLDVA